MTDDLITRLEALSAKATKAPWDIEDNGRFGSITADTPCGNGWIICDLSTRTDMVCNDPEDMSRKLIGESNVNAALIVELVNNLPAILDALKARAA